MFFPTMAVIKAHSTYKGAGMSTFLDVVFGWIFIQVHFVRGISH
jgi:hypothetical protein